MDVWPGGGAVSVQPDVILAVRELLDGRSRSKAMSGPALARAVSGVVGRIQAVRRVGEAVENLRAQGLPICSTSAEGYWTAQTAEEVEASVRESRRRALASLRQFRLMRRAWLELSGQARLIRERRAS